MELEYPQWVIDLQKQASDMGYGRIQAEFVVANGNIGKVITNKSTQVKFKPHMPDQNGARLLVIDAINTGPTDGTVTFAVIKKSGQVSQINTFDTNEQNYPV